MIICPKCKNGIEGNSKFCTKCGYSLYFNKAENLEQQVLIKCGIIAVVIAMIFSLL